MKKSNLILSSVSILSAVLPVSGVAKEKPKARPNILYIMSDDHDAKAISAYGSGLNSTPNIDRIAKEGMLFRNCFVNNSISGPCRASVLTGKFSNKNGFYDNQPGTIFDGSQETFPKLLQAVGYQTAIIGKWHLGSIPTGFDYYSVHVGQGTYYSPEFVEPEGHKTYNGAYAADITLENSIKWLEKTDKSKPFCLMMHFKAPHRNWMPALDKMNMYEDHTFPVPANFFDDFAGRLAAKEQKMSIAKNMNLEGDLKMLGFVDTESGESLENELKRMTPAQRAVFDKVYLPIKEDFVKRNLTGKELTLWKYQRFMRDYMKCISSVDDNVGKMIDYLKQKGLWENTIVVYTSDQGFYLGEHGWFDKRWMYEESFHTPFIVSYPKMIKKGTTSNALIQNIDFAPTFLDLVGIKVPTDMQGESLKQIFNGTKTSIRNALYYHYYEFPLPHGVNRHYGVRTNRYKLIHFYDNIDAWELYDLKNDPTEMKNQINNPAFGKIKEDLMIQLKKLQKKYDDNQPTEGYPFKVKNQKNR